MPEHLIPLLLTTTFALIWAIAAASHVVDSLHKVRKNRPGIANGPHFSKMKKSGRSPGEAS